MVTMDLWKISPWNPWKNLTENEEQEENQKSHGMKDEHTKITNTILIDWYEILDYKTIWG